MVVEGAHTLAASREAVWALLQDPEVIGKIMPGATGMVQTADGRCEGRIRLALGAVAVLEFELQIALADVFPPERYTMHINAEGKLGSVRGTALVELLPDATGPGTLLHYKTDLRVGGTLGAMGPRVLDSAGGMMARQGLEALTEELERRLGGPRPG